MELLIIVALVGAGLAAVTAELVLARKPAEEGQRRAPKGNRG